MKGMSARALTHKFGHPHEKRVATIVNDDTVMILIAIISLRIMIVMMINNCIITIIIVAIEPMTILERSR